MSFRVLRAPMSREQHHTFSDRLVMSHLFLQEKEELNRNFYKDFGVGRVCLEIPHYWGLSSKYASKIFTVRQGFGPVRSVFTPVSLKREQG